MYLVDDCFKALLTLSSYLFRCSVQAVGQVKAFCFLLPNHMPGLHAAELFIKKVFVHMT